MSAPAKTNPTTASSGNMSITLSMSRAMMRMGMLVRISASVEAMPSDTKMGQPTTRQKTMTTQRTISADMDHASSCWPGTGMPSRKYRRHRWRMRKLWSMKAAGTAKYT